MSSYTDCSYEVTSESGDSEVWEDDHLDSTGNSAEESDNDKSFVSPAVMYFINSNVTVVNNNPPEHKKDTLCACKADTATTKSRTRRQNHRPTGSEEKLALENTYLKQQLLDLKQQVLHLEQWQNNIEIILLRKELQLALEAERLYKQVYENILQPPRWFAGQRFHFIESRNVMRKRKPPRRCTNVHGDTGG